jgi:hypothetical protein
MHSRVRAVVLASAALVAIAPSGGAAALAARSGPAPSHTAVSQSLTWTIVPSANRSPRRYGHSNQLNDISCVSASACTAVGWSVFHDFPKTLIEAWNGTAWSLTPSPNRSSDDILNRVSCASASACAAVGDSYSRHHPYRTLIEMWNGTAWSIVPSPNPATGTGVDRLFGVSCASATACTAVGYYYGPRDSESKPLIMTWNGSTWSRVHAPGKGIHSSLSTVSCAGADFCTAVGGYSSPSSPRSEKTLIESWNGTAWSVVPSPNALLDSVSCVSADFCAAVGGYGKTQTEMWNGTAWSVVPSPNAGQATDVNTLLGVSCAAADSCTAAGYYIVPGAKVGQPTLIESWDGTAWSVVASPNPPKSFNSLNGVSCPSATGCMAAGWRDGTATHGVNRTLTELGTSPG